MWIGMGAGSYCFRTIRRRFSATSCSTWYDRKRTEAEAGRAGLDGDFYLCAPVAFLSEVQAGLERKGVKPDRIHVESFGPVG
jgi:ferredoxin-NADP reductase